jgi:excisionase family DNA binding protein
MTVAAVEQYNVWTVEEAAAYLRIGRTKAYALARAGELGAFRVGAQVRIDRADLMAWIRAQGTRP